MEKTSKKQLAFQMPDNHRALSSKVEAEVRNHLSKLFISFYKSQQKKDHNHEQNSK